MKQNERTIQKAVIKYLSDREKFVRDLTYLHVPNEGKRMPHTGAYLKAQGLRAGAPDLIVWPKNKPTLQIELKSWTGRQSEAQKNFEVALKNLNHNYHLLKCENGAHAIAQIEELLHG